MGGLRHDDDSDEEEGVDEDEDDDDENIDQDDDDEEREGEGGRGEHGEAEDEPHTAWESAEAVEEPENLPKAHHRLAMLLASVGDTKRAKTAVANCIRVRSFALVLNPLANSGALVCAVLSLSLSHTHARTHELTFAMCQLEPDNHRCKLFVSRGELGF